MENGNTQHHMESGNGGVEIPAEDTAAAVDDGVWDRLVARITRRRRKGEGRHRYILPHHLSHDEGLEDNYRKILDMQKHYADNKIRTTKYTVLSFLPKNLFEQFHRFANCYFVFIILLNFIPAIEAVEPFLSMAPVITILMIQGIKDIAEDYGRYKSDGQVNNSKTEVYKRYRLLVLWVVFFCICTM